jgi:ubiquinone biosynthesis protein UbiJ
MSAHGLAMSSLETAIDSLLGLDPAAREALAALHGKVIGIEVRGLGICFFAAPDAAGRLQLLANYEGEPDCWMRGTLMGLARAGAGSAGAAPPLSGDVQIDGDSALAHRFGQILGGLDVDWEEQLSRLTGDVVAHEIGGAARAGAELGRRAARTAGDNLREYLQEEARLVPTRYEVREFLADVDTLRDDVERLAVRVQRLGRTAAEAGESS